MDPIESAVERSEAALGATDVLVNNAGWDRVGYFLDTDPALWRDIIAINLWGPLNMHHAVLKRMARRGGAKDKD